MNVSEIICKRIDEFEKEKGARVILAVESGSRAWGFASTDSDYDVRFVYQHPQEEYLNMHKPKDCYNWMDKENNIDYVGFDIYKFYDLLLKSNMNTIDWVENTLVYSSSIKNKKVLQTIISKEFNRNTYISHNYGLCAKNYHKYFLVPKENEPTAKRYVYCIRALLSAKYCADTGKLAPLDFYELLDGVDICQKDREEIIKMVEIKKKDREKKWYRNTVWDTWISEALNGEHVKSDEDHDFEKYYAQLNQHLLEQFEHPPTVSCEAIK